MFHGFVKMLMELLNFYYRTFDWWKTAEQELLNGPGRYIINQDLYHSANTKLVEIIETLRYFSG